jgi:predicted nucleotidyltransferase component of viral defense system
MIQQETLTQQWIDTVSKSNRKADKILVEKVIRALLLLEGLANSELPFIFKGGTALMLLLNSAKRLSIDIDIIVLQRAKKLRRNPQLLCGKTRLQLSEVGGTKEDIQHLKSTLQILLHPHSQNT